MKRIHWLGHEVELAESDGGVLAFRDPWEGLVRGGVQPWPPPELLQKLYQSRQIRAFTGAQSILAGHSLGHYCDLQSVHSEDAVTWSLFGPILYSAPEVRSKFAVELLASLDIMQPPVSTNIWLWRRIPHPDNLAPGGPEIDFGIQTEETLLLGEAKWRSGVGAAQGVERNKDQIQLRVEFCSVLGQKLFPGVRKFVVLAVGRSPGLLTADQRLLEGGTVVVKESTWATLGRLPSNPYRSEFEMHLAWREAHSKR